MIKKAVLFLFLILPVVLLGQTVSTNLDLNQSGWTLCFKPTCDPGGNPDGPTLGSPKVFTTSGWPYTLEITESGTNSNLLVYYDLGAKSSTYFNIDLYAMPTLASHFQALEYDVFEYLSPYRYMFGSQCDIGKVWDIWDGLHGQWIPTTVPCNLSIGKWNHVQWFVHRETGTGCQGFPCLVYDTLGVNNIYYNINMKEPSEYLHTGWANMTGLNVQIDISGTGSATEYVKDVNVYQY